MPLGENKDISLDLLLLDSENPRLSASDATSDQGELLRRLWQEMAVDEIALSIAYNGFYPAERLLVIKSGKKADGKYIVIEGNRRLAAVLILTNDTFRKNLKATDIPTITGPAKKRLENLPCTVYESREDVWTYIGFRHINGPKPWGSFSKARHIVMVHEQYGVPLSEIANRVGDRNSTVTRLYRGFKILQQAERAGKFDMADRYRARFAFSHLYTALDQNAFQVFLGIDPADEPKDQLVPKSKGANLAELMTWLYGKKSEDKIPLIRSQNPDLNQLRDVVGNPRALAALRGGRSLERAFELSVGDDRRFREAMTLAKDELQLAKGTVVTGYDGEDDLWEAATDSKLLVDDLLLDMNKKRTKSAKK